MLKAYNSWCLSNINSSPRALWKKTSLLLRQVVLIFSPNGCISSIMHFLQCDLNTVPVKSWNAGLFPLQVGRLLWLFQPKESGRSDVTWLPRLVSKDNIVSTWFSRIIVLEFNATLYNNLTATKLSERPTGPQRDHMEKPEHWPASYVSFSDHLTVTEWNTEPGPHSRAIPEFLTHRNHQR